MNAKRVIAACFLGMIAMVFSVCGGNAASEQPRLVFVEGDVRISVDGVAWEEARRGGRLEQDWTLDVGKNGGVVVMFPDGSEVKLAGSTRVKITDLRFGKKSKVIELKLAYGRLLARAKKLLTKESRFNVTAGSAVCGVRGTEFLVTYRDGKFEIKNVEGKVFVRLEDDVRYVDGGRKIRGDMKKLGKILRLDKDDRDEINQLHRRFKGMLPVGGESGVKPEGDKADGSGPRLGLRLRERGNIGAGQGVIGSHLRDSVGHLADDGGNALAEGSDNATGNVILPNVNVVILY